MIRENSKELITRMTDYGIIVRYAGGGQLPAVLDGLYTSYELANRAIENYEATKRNRSSSNGTSKTDDRKIQLR